MKQTRLGFKPESTIKTQRNDFDQRNLATAREILANPDQHGGADAFPVIWARSVIQRLEGKV